jgi:SAM-dependent methyltransferase
MSIAPASKASAASASSVPSVSRARTVNVFGWSRNIARRIERAVLGSYSLESIYRDTIRNAIGDGSLVLDAGAGERCIYAGGSLRIIGSDMLLGDLKNNPDVKFAVVSDLERGFPFRPNSLDAVTACYFVEHIQDCEKFVRDAASVLRPGGKLFLLFPCRYAPFAVINRVVSNKLTVKMLQWFVESSNGGFPANYNDCWPSRMREILERNGLKVVGTECCFYQSHYYASFLPIYLCSLAYDLLMRALDLERMAASVCMFAEKTARTRS